MGEYYWGEADLVFPESLDHLPLAELFDPTPLFDAEVWVDNFIVDKYDTTLEGLTPEQMAEREALSRLLVSIASWTEGAEVLTQEGLTIHIGGEHNFGCAFFYEHTDLQEVCQTLGISYRLSDEGVSGFPGEEIIWDPSMKSPINLGHSQQGRVLDSYDLDAITKRAGIDDALFAVLVRSYFHDPAEYARLMSPEENSEPCL